MTRTLALDLLLATLLLTMLIRLPHALRARQRVIVHSRKDTQERWLLALVGSGMMLLPVLYAASTWLDSADYSFEPWLAWIGAVLLLPTLWLFWRSHRDLGLNWSVTLEIGEQHGLVTQGVYRHIRHPMYAAVWLWTLAQALLVANWIVAPAGLLTFALMYWLRVPREEAMMRQRFGREYEDYMQRTGSLLPR